MYWFGFTFDNLSITFTITVYIYIHICTFNYDNIITQQQLFYNKTTITIQKKNDNNVYTSTLIVQTVWIFLNDNISN